MIGVPPAYTNCYCDYRLPPSVQRRVKALKKLQFESTKIEAEFYQAVHELECKFAAKYGPIYNKVSIIVMFPSCQYNQIHECYWSAIMATKVVINILI